MSTKLQAKANAGAHDIQPHDTNKTPSLSFYADESFDAVTSYT